MRKRRKYLILSRYDLFIIIRWERFIMHAVIFYMWAVFFQKKFSIPKCGEAFFLKTLLKKWKNYKCQLKGVHIHKYKTKDAFLKNRPSCIPRDQWSVLISYWLSTKAKVSTNIYIILQVVNFHSAQIFVRSIYIKKS